MKYLFSTIHMTVHGLDCKSIPGWLKPDLEWITRCGWADTRVETVKTLARPYKSLPVKAEAGLTTATYITPEGKIFSYISGKVLGRKVGKLIYHQRLDETELEKYLENLRREAEAEVVIEPAI